jgi:hypothetical protein
MKRMLVVTLIGVAAGAAAMQSKTAWDFYQNIYPSDPAKRQALELCLLGDVNFNRLDPDARGKCYQHALAEPVPAAEAARTDRTPNQIDFRQYAGRGPTPRNDVRLVQQTSGQSR